MVEGRNDDRTEDGEKEREKVERSGDHQKDKGVSVEPRTLAVALARDAG